MKLKPIVWGVWAFCVLASIYVINHEWHRGLGQLIACCICMILITTYAVGIAYFLTGKKEPDDRPKGNGCPSSVRGDRGRSHSSRITTEDVRSDSTWV